MMKITSTAKERKDDGAIVIPYAIDVIPAVKSELSGGTETEDQKLPQLKTIDDEQDIVVPLTFRQKWGSTIMACCVGMLTDDIMHLVFLQRKFVGYFEFLNYHCMLSKLSQYQ